jgi:hypothetical protein
MSRKSIDADFRARLAERETFWEAKFAQLGRDQRRHLDAVRAEREQERAQLALEREALAQEDYKAQRITAELQAKTIAPQFIPFITGSSREAIDAAIELATST